MSTKSTTFLVESETPWENIGEGVRRQIMGYDDRIMMVKVEFEVGAVGALHEHFHSQVTYVASGKFEATIGDEKKVLSVGDGFYAEPDAQHGVSCIEKGVLVDIFTPQREDFIKK